jgi:rifampicin phosphotransferase
VLTLPFTILKASRMMSVMWAQAATFAGAFPRFVADGMPSAAPAYLTSNLDDVDAPHLVALYTLWCDRTLNHFARESLKPTVFADLAWSMLFEMLKPKLGEERAWAAVAELSLGAQPPAEANLAQGVRDLASGAITRAAFLDRFGHRCTNEMELSQPRWYETPEELDRLVGAASAVPPHVNSQRPWEPIADEAKLTGATRDEFKLQVERLRMYLGLREAAKHYLLMGYAVIRRALVELDRRFALNGGLFFLTPADFPDLCAGKDLTPKIAAARKRRQTELTLDVPHVLFGDDLDAIGRPQPEPTGGDKLNGVALSAGVAEGPALVLTEPTAAPPEGGYILVCPSTDPAWVPLFTRAAGLVMETGGVLSHGAIVAREFGLPAVAGLPGA